MAWFRVVRLILSECTANPVDLDPQCLRGKHELHTSTCLHSEAYIKDVVWSFVALFTTAPTSDNAPMVSESSAPTTPRYPFQHA